MPLSLATMAQASKRNFFGPLVLAGIAIAGILFLNIGMGQKLTVLFTVILVLYRRYFIGDHQFLAALAAETFAFIMVCIMLPGLYAAVLIVSLILRFRGQYTPSQVRPRTFSQQNISPYLGISISSVKVLLWSVDLDFSHISETDLTPKFQGALGILFLICVLSDLIKKRGEVYEGLAKELAEKEKNWTLELLSLLSHNIRTPIATMGTRIEVIKLKVDQNLPVAPKDLESLSAASENVSTIVNQLLSKTARNQLKHKEGKTTLEECIKGLDNNCFEVLNFQKIDFNLSSTNAIALQLCLDSLLSNAQKYGGKHVILDISQSQEGYCLKVQDDGLGMTPEQLQVYGTPFNISNTRGGTGLGVYFTLKLIGDKGWQWKVDSEKDVGTTVSITIPQEKLFF